jgi:hypothetical protein
MAVSGMESVFQPVTEACDEVTASKVPGAPPLSL